MKRRKNALHKRIISWLCVITLVLGMMPTQMFSAYATAVSAEEIDEETEEESTGEEAAEEETTEEESTAEEEPAEESTTEEESAEEETTEEESAEEATIEEESVEEESTEEKESGDSDEAAADDFADEDSEDADETDSENAGDTESDEDADTEEIVEADSDTNVEEGSDVSGAEDDESAENSEAVAGIIGSVGSGIALASENGEEGEEESEEGTETTKTSVTLNVTIEGGSGSDGSFVYGDTLTVVVEATAGEGEEATTVDGLDYSYQWYSDDEEAIEDAASKDFTPSSVGTYYVIVSFSGNSTYGSADGKSAVTVDKTDATVSVEQKGTAQYLVDDVVFNLAISVPGTFKFNNNTEFTMSEVDASSGQYTITIEAGVLTPELDAEGNVTEGTLEYTFTPSDTSNYNILTDSVSYTVEKADPVVEVDDVTVEYPEEVKFELISDVPGVFNINDEEEVSVTINESGSYVGSYNCGIQSESSTISYTFTPNSGYYNTVDGVAGYAVNITYNYNKESISGNAAIVDAINEAIQKANKNASIEDTAVAITTSYGTAITLPLPSVDDEELVVEGAEIEFKFSVSKDGEDISSSYASISDLVKDSSNWGKGTYVIQWTYTVTPASSSAGEGSYEIGGTVEVEVNPIELTVSFEAEKTYDATGVVDWTDGEDNEITISVGDNYEDIVSVRLKNTDTDSNSASGDFGDDYINVGKYTFGEDNSADVTWSDIFEIYLIENDKVDEEEYYTFGEVSGSLTINPASLYLAGISISKDDDGNEKTKTYDASSSVDASYIELSLDGFVDGTDEIFAEYFTLTGISYDTVLYDNEAEEYIKESNVAYDDSGNWTGLVIEASATESSSVTLTVEDAEDDDINEKLAVLLENYTLGNTDEIIDAINEITETDGDEVKLTVIPFGITVSQYDILEKYSDGKVTVPYDSALVSYTVEASNGDTDIPDGTDVYVNPIEDEDSSGLAADWTVVDENGDETSYPGTLYLYNVSGNDFGVYLDSEGITIDLSGNYEIVVDGSFEIEVVPVSVGDNVSLDLTTDTDGTFKLSYGSDNDNFEISFAQGSEKTTTDDGGESSTTYWYGPDVSLSLSENSGYSLWEKNTSADGTVTYSQITLGSDDYILESIESGSFFNNLYICEDASNIFYGTVSIKYLYDKTPPTVTLTGAVYVDSDGKEIDDNTSNSLDLGNSTSNMIQYTITLEDTGTDGTAVSGLYEDEVWWASYYEGVLSAWNSVSPVALEDGKYQFTAIIPAYGTLYIKASDYAGNITIENALRSLVVEDDKPVVHIAIDSNSVEEGMDDNVTGGLAYKNTHTFSFIAYDALEEYAETFDYSGIQKVVWVLSGEEDYSYTDEVTKTTPEELKGVADVRVVTETGIDLPDDLEGTYTLTVIAYDFSGNASEPATATLNFDNTDPTAYIVMTDGIEYENDGVYYRADNSEIKITVDDNLLCDDNPVKYEITVTGGENEEITISGSSKTGISDISNSNTDWNKEGITAASEDTDEDDVYEIVITITNDVVCDTFSDGNVYVTISLTDSAENSSQTFNSVGAESAPSAGVVLEDTSSDDVNSNKAVFILDTTAPELTKVWDSTDSITDNYYADDYELNGETQDAVYYNSEFTTYYETTETNYDSGKVNVNASAVETATSEEDKETTLKSDDYVIDTSDQEAVSITLTPENNTKSDVYIFTIAVTDKAGNTLEVEKSGLSNGAAYNVIASEDEKIGTVAVLDAVRVIDNFAPEVVMDYSNTMFEGIDGSLLNYDTENGIAYYNVDLTAVITFADSNLDTDRLQTGYIYASDIDDEIDTEEINNSVNVAKGIAEGEFEDDFASYSAENVDSAATPTAQVTYVISADNTTDGCYCFQVLGYDKAGNGLSVTDYMDAGGETSNEATTEASELYTSVYTKVMDTIQPTVIMTYTERDATYYYKEGVYYSESFSAEYLFEDTNLNTDYMYDGSGAVYTYGVDEADEIDLTKSGEMVLDENNEETSTYIVTQTVDTDENDDGVYYFTVSGMDWAGNPVYVYEEQITSAEEDHTIVSDDDTTTVDNNGTYSTYTGDSKILDNTAPEVVITYTATDNEDDCYDDSDIAYYNLDFTATYTFTDYSLDYNKLFTNYSHDGEDQADEYDCLAETIKSQTSTSTTAKMTTSYTIEADDISELADGHDNDGTYLFKVYGEDKAGNGLIVTEYLTSGTAGDSYTSGTETVHNGDNPYTGYYSKVMDTIQPTVTITYTEREDTYYYEEGAYYNVDFNAFLTFADTNLNMDYVGSGYTFTQIGDGEVSEPTSATVDNVITWTVTTGTGDGQYKFTVSGKDWAGNPVYVYEEQINGYDSGQSNAVREASTEVSSAKVYSSYTTLGKIMDTVAPTLDIAYTALSDDYYYDDSEALDGSEINAYYNKAITTTYTFNDESGLDYSKIFAGRAFEADESLETVDAALAVTAIGSTQADMADGSDVVKSWTIPASESYNGIYHYLAYGEDKAGNTLVITENGLMGGESMTTEDCGTTYTAQGKVLDTVSPVYTSAMLPDLDLETNPDTVDELFSAYYNQDVKAQFTVEDTNIDTGLVNVAVTSFAGEVEDYYNYVPTWADITLTKTTQYATTQVYTTDTVSVDGVYRFEISGRDKAGNLLVQSEAEEAKADTYLETLKVTDGPYWTYNKVRDTVAPVLDLSILAGTMEIFAARLSLSSGVQSGETTLAVTKNMPYQSESTGSASILTSDMSPTSIAYTFKTTGAGTDPTNTNMTRTYGTLGTTASDSSGWSVNNAVSSITFDGQQTVEITLLSVKDRAGNEVIASVSTGSYYNGSVINKLYLDVQAPGGDGVGAVVDLSYPSSYSTVITGAGPVGNPLYNGSIQITATVEDPYGNADTQYASSGLYRVYFEVLVNGVAVDPGLVSASGSGTTGSEGSVDYIDYGTSGVGTDFASDTSELNEKLTYSDTITFTFNPDGTVFNNNNIELRVWVEDNSGNGGTTYDSNSSKNVYAFGMDVTVPLITVSYDNNDAQNEFYFKETRTATVVVTERNFDPDTTYIETESAAVISGWTYTSGSESNHDDDTWTATVSYVVDNDYTFTADTTDRAGWSNSGIDYGSSVAPESFTLDMTNPVIYVVFDNNDALNGNYYLAARTATITIEEHNFRSAEAIVAIAKYVSDSVMTAAAGVPSEGGWSTSGDTSTAQVYFGDDGYYTMTVDYTDLAGNPAVQVVVDPFTIDLTAPTVDITAGGLADQTIFGPDSEININVADWFDDTNIDPSAGVTFELEKVVWNTDSKDISSGERNEEVSAFASSTVTGNYSELRYLVGETDSYTGTDSYSWYQITDTSESVDGLYRLTIYATDLAGNPSQDTVTFIINRYDSVYMVDSGTSGSVLTSVGNTYIQDVEGGLVIYEYSLDVLSDGLIDLYINGIHSRIRAAETNTVETENGSYTTAVYTSDEGEEYELIYTEEVVWTWNSDSYDENKTTDGGSETFGWVLRTYQLGAEAFKDDSGQYVNGQYELRLYSMDATGNEMWNYRTLDNADVNGVQSRAISLVFNIDMEDPVIAIQGITQDEIYDEEYKEVTITYNDNDSMIWLGVLVTTNELSIGAADRSSYGDMQVNGVTSRLEYYSILFAATYTAENGTEYYSGVYQLNADGSYSNVAVNGDGVKTLTDEELSGSVYSVSDVSDLTIVYMMADEDGSGSSQLCPVLVYAMSPLNLDSGASEESGDGLFRYVLRVDEDKNNAIYIRVAAGDEAGNRTDVTEDTSIGHTNHTVTVYSFRVTTAWYSFIFDMGFDSPLQALLVFGGGAMVVIFAVTLAITAIRRRRLLVAGKKKDSEEDEEQKKER
ncbi:MAG: hypothetical protein LUE16_02605 [Lachnospiraceae bacterium]|nr:hypothetical protein [Lachnospiraceae bacterium]